MIFFSVNKRSHVLSDIIERLKKLVFKNNEVSFLFTFLYFHFLHSGFHFPFSVQHITVTVLTLNTLFNQLFS
jgi:hypothetical protein